MVPSEHIRPAGLGTLRILVADDHEVVRQGLRTLLEKQPAWKVCGEATTGTEAVEKTRQLRPDIVILDIHMPEMDGLQAAREILVAQPQTAILILTLDESAEVLRQVSEVGAQGVVMKSDVAHDLVSAVSALARHEPFYTPKASGIVLRSYARPLGATPAKSATGVAELTSREREIAVLVAEGRSSKEISATLHIGSKTVESHRRNLMHKLKLRAVADLVRYAMREGLIKP